MIYQDDRTPEEHKTHTWLVTATDRFMSGWGHAATGVSKVAWACRQEHMDAVLAWVEAREEMKYVDVHRNDWHPRNAAHVHIYTVNSNHPAIA